MRTILAAFAVAAWLACNGALWFLRPPDSLRLLGSALLGTLFFGRFPWYLVARHDPVDGA